MKKILSMLGVCALMTTGCVVGVRSNMNFIHKSIDAKNEAKVKEENKWNGGSPAVNADKSYSDMLNGSGNNNGAGQNSRDESDKQKDEAPTDNKTEDQSQDQPAKK